MSIIVALFPHSTDRNEGVHFHDEIIVEDWIQAHEQGLVVIPAHQTAGQIIDAIPLLIQAGNASLNFSFAQFPSQLTAELLFDNLICVRGSSAEIIANGSMVIAPLEFPEIALEGWLDESGCVLFVARHDQNQLLTYDIDCPNSLAKQSCSGRFIIPANTGKIWDMNIEAIIQNLDSNDEIRIKVVDSESDSPLGGVGFHVHNRSIGVSDDSGLLSISGDEVENSSILIDGIEDSVNLVLIEIEGLRMELKVQNGSTNLPLMLARSVHIQTVDQYSWSWKGVAVSFVSDEELGGIMTELGTTDERGELLWQGLLPVGAHQIVGITANQSLPIPEASAFSTVTGTPTYLNRFSVGNSLYLTAFSMFGLLGFAGSISLGLLALGCWNLSRNLNLSLSSQWIGSILMNANGTMVIISHADLMSDLHSAALLMLGASLSIQFFSNGKHEENFSEWGDLLLSGLCLGLAFSIRFVNLLYLPMIILIPLIRFKESNFISRINGRKCLGLVVLFSCILLALTPTLSYHHSQHGHMMNYNISDDESDPSTNTLYHEWNSASATDSDAGNLIAETSGRSNEITTMAQSSTSVSDLTESSGWIPVKIHERSYSAQFLTILIVALMYAPVIVLAILIHIRTMWKGTDDREILTAKNWFFMFILIGFAGLMVERSPFFVSHWSDDNRYFTPMIAPSAILCSMHMPSSKKDGIWKERHMFALIGGLCSTLVLVALPRMLWRGTRRPMTTAIGLLTDGRFDLTFFYHYTNTPRWILDAQFYWHPFSERLTYATYEVAALLVSVASISYLLWNWKGTEHNDEEA